MEEDKLRKEKKMDEHYERMSERVNKKHNLDMAREKSLLTKEMANIGEEIIRAFRKLADMGPEELLTEVSRKEYLVQKEQLEYYTDVHNGTFAFFLWFHVVVIAMTKLFGYKILAMSINQSSNCKHQDTKFPTCGRR
ncbi:uncharacterized protein LOC127256757 isoform X1 [Andrographis paniculata]|uniref:uncharacterized protein LOC127256757 isoform X1 n=1 Tax=Andrographis paniculata TaxID=175694 RepID=UPI0021E7A3B7|nr:uncharacterized protein LOC127256757 isoform X1 [Andrographis paniculata]